MFKSLNIANWFNSFSRRTKLSKVFTPFAIPTFTYVDRPAIESQFRNYLAMPGVQLVICGPAGSGKTTLVSHSLRQASLQYIVTSCQESTTIDSLLKDAFSKLPARFNQSRHQRRWARIAAALNPVQGEDCLPLHITPQRLGEILGNENIVWVIEQFHLVAESERTYMLEIVKVFSDLTWIHGSPKIVISGNCLTALELFYYQSNMGNRIGEVEVPYMHRQELLTLIRLGEKALQLSIPHEMRIKLVYHSINLPLVCHQLSLILCLQNNIWRAKKQDYFIPGSDMKELLSLYLRYYKNKFRGSFFKALDFTGGHNIQGVMKAVSAAGHNGIGLDAIWHNGLCKNMTLAQLKHDLQMLTSPECGNTLCFDMCIDLYMYSSPYLAAYAGMYFSAERNSRQEKNNQKKGTHPPVQDKQFEKISKRLNTLQPSP